VFSDSRPIFGFVWRAQEITESVENMARRTGSHAVFDLSQSDPAAATSALKAVGAGHVKVSYAQITTATFESFLEEAHPQTVWIEYHPTLSETDPESFITELRHLNGRCNCVPVIGDPRLLNRLVSGDWAPPAIALKGSESAGFAGSETTGILYSTARRLLDRHQRKIDLMVWGGVATPEAAAAFLATGARGIVFESLHWLTDEVQADPAARRRIAHLRHDHTTRVSMDPGVSLRILDKGNSAAVKKLRKRVAAIPGHMVVPERSGRAFAEAVGVHIRSALEDSEDPRDLVIVGSEAGFARSFVERFGQDSGAAIEAFINETGRLCREAANFSDHYIEHPLAKRLGTDYPFLQGAMTWISDVPEFARAVAEAGGLPTLALGFRDRKNLEEELGRMRSLLGAHPYAVNVVALPENLYLDEQLAWIREHRPPFAVIGAGPPSFAKMLCEQGIETFYIAPDEGLLVMALESGVRYVILEGNEAGGHVGAYSTLTLAQIALELRRRRPELFAGRYIVLAGGIFDRETAFRAAMVGADGLQLGTAYLATEEIVATGALSRLYQDRILRSRPGDTVVSGESAGLGVRSLKTPKVNAIRALERAFLTGKENEESFRRQLESLGAGSLLMAARGIRGSDGGSPDEEVRFNEGQFMSGAVAGAINSVYTIDELHYELAQGRLELVMPEFRPGASRRVPARTRRVNRKERLAITGMAMVNSLGADPDEIWQNAVSMKSGIVEVPASRWEHRLYYDPDPRVPEKTYCKVGAFQDLTIDRKTLATAPQDFRAMSNSTKLTLWLAHHAINDSGIAGSDVPRERIGVLVSQNSGESASTLTDIVIRSAAGKLVSSLHDVIRMTQAEALAAERRIKRDLMQVDDSTLLGRLNSTAGGFICQRYGFMGPTYAVSAACATSLAAVHSAVQMIRNGILDAAVVGGGEESLTQVHFLEFAAIGALAGVSGTPRPPEASSRPFDAGRDGMVLGEGGGMIVIEAESVAKARGAHIYGYITGVGGGNSDRGMVESQAESQQAAIGAAFRDAGYGPDRVSLVDCHATGTIQGDIEEVKALKWFYEPNRSIALSAFKSQIGHTLGAAGISSLIRSVQAMKNKTVPGTLNYEVSEPAMELKHWGFRVPPEPEEWKHDPDRPRRAQINAFGFGGANYVVHLEECRNHSATPAISIPPSMSSPHTFPETQPALPQVGGISFFRAGINGDRYRLAVVSEKDSEARVIAEKYLTDPEGFPMDESKRKPAREGVYLGLEGEPPVPLAFVFPGQGSCYASMGQELYESVPVFREWLDRIAEGAEFDLLKLLFVADDATVLETRWQQPALFAIDTAIARSFLSLGVRPRALAGHSVGELSALCAADVFSREDGVRIVRKRAELMDRVGRSSEDPGVMMAVNAPTHVLDEKISGKAHVFFTNFNSPNQVVLGGSTKPISELADELEKDGYRCTRLKVSMAFHSPALNTIRGEFETFLSGIVFHAPRIPVISNTTNTFFPDDPEEIKNLLASQIECPVHWMQNIKKLWDDAGIRCFLEVGPGGVLSDLIADTLERAVCVETCRSSRETHTYRTALARLYALGNVQDGIRPNELNVSQEAVLRSSSVARKSPTGFSEGPETIGYLEQVIQIIMDATGYERHEIEPDMDLREDLAIRSSRLPVIMDMAERRFGIIINLKDFVGIHTVRQVADRIKEVVLRDGSEARVHEEAENPPLTPLRSLKTRRSKEAVEIECDPIQRFVFEEAPLKRSFGRALEIDPDRTVVLLNGSRTSVLAEELARFFEDKCHVRPITISCLGASEHGKSYDLRTKEGAESAGAFLAQIEGLAGLTLVFDGEGPGIGDVDEVPAFLAGFFTTVQRLLHSSHKAFCFLFHREADPRTPFAVAAEGVLGLFLAARREYGSVLFRSIKMDINTGIEEVISQALDTGMDEVQVIYHDRKPYTLGVRVQDAALAEEPDLRLNRGDVVVVSGGGKGITAWLARALAPFGPRLVLLGRTQPDASMDYDAILDAQGPIESAIRDYLEERRPNADKAGIEAAFNKIKAGAEIHGTIRDLRAGGMEVEYHSCDVTRKESVSAVLERVVKRYVRIDGIIHGAGILRDAFMEFMTREDFLRVMDVKLTGAWNLYNAAKSHGLQFMVGLSSIVAALGNIGQTNYCSANRALGALLRARTDVGRGIATKTLLLPPIDGAGMAGDDEIKALMKLRGMADAYVHVKELMELFCREMFAVSGGPSEVMWSRPLPESVSGGLRINEIPLREGRPLSSGGTAFPFDKFPMVDSVRRLDLEKGELETERSFNLNRDLWLEDHRPFQFTKHPLISGVMIVEMLLEAAKLLYPYLQIHSLCNVEFSDVLECLPDIDCLTRTLARRSVLTDGKTTCDVSVMSQDVSPSGRHTGHWYTRSRGEVVLGGGQDSAVWRIKPSVKEEDLVHPPVHSNEIQDLYRNFTRLRGRYRVLEKVHGVGAGVIRGGMVYRKSRDLAEFEDTNYLYPPYLLEALQHLVAYYNFIVRPEYTLAGLPVGFEEMRFRRLCRSGERISISARMTSEDETGQCWEAWALDEAEEPVMWVRGLGLRWLSV